ncbi:hypothetical protein ACU4GD_45300 [Cupriavidus basilensis]
MTRHLALAIGTHLAILSASAFFETFSAFAASAPAPLCFYAIFGRIPSADK